MSQIDWNALSEEELAGLLKNAGKALEDRKLSARKEGMDKIRETGQSHQADACIPSSFSI